MKIKYSKFILQTARPYKWIFINLFLCVLVTSFMSTLYPYILGLLVDQVFIKKNSDLFMTIIVCFAVAFTIEQILHMILNALWSYLMTKFLLDFRISLFKKVLSLEAKSLDKLDTGDTLTIINKDIDEIMSLIHWNVFYLIANAIKLMTAFILVYLISYKLMLAMSICIPIIYLTNGLIGRKIESKIEEYRTLYGKNISWIIEIISGIRDIRLLGKSKYITQKVIGNYNQLTRIKIQKDILEVKLSRINDFILLIAQLIIFFISAYLININEMTVGEFVSSFLYFSIMRAMFTNLAQANVRLQHNKVSIRRVLNIIDEKSEPDDNHNSTYRINNGEIIFENIDFSYNSSKVLKKFNLKINQGEHIAIVGKSGAGKSTIINLLLGFYQFEGNLLIDNRPINDYSLKEIRKKIGVVPQKPVIFHGTIRDNLVLKRKDISDEKILEICEQVNLASVIQSFSNGLDTVIGPNDITLSGGQQQLISIARIFLKDPKIIVFDEATSALDTLSERQVHEANRLLKVNRTCITIAHRLSSILEADKIAIINNGEIEAINEHEILLESNETYKTLYLKSQCEGEAI